MSESSTSPTVALVEKLREVALAIGHVEKRGRNDFHKYDYVQAEDVLRDVRTALLARKVIVLPGALAGSVRHFTETGGKGFVTTVDLYYRFVDTETGAEVEVSWTGAGADTGGDKGLYKAYTGGLKYALLSLFMIPTGDDPEKDRTTEAGGGQSTVTQDAERPAAPRIPIDRAKAILEAAKDAGLVQDDDAFSPVLKAKLADVGVAKIGALNVDQAEAVEAFIAQEKAGA